MYAPPLVDRLLLPYEPYSVCLREPTDPVRVLDEDAFTVRFPMEPHLGENRDTN